MTRTTIRPDSGGTIDLELHTDDTDTSIMLTVTAAAPDTTHFALSPETARQIALALLEQVDAYEHRT